MNKLTQKVLKRLRKIHSKISPQSHSVTRPDVDYRKQDANDQIRALLAGNQPRLVSRLGGTEAPAMISYMDMTSPRPFLRKSADYIKGRTNRFWWDDKVKSDIYHFSGFFPPTEEMLEKYSIYMLDILKQIDLLGSWLKEERRLTGYFSPSLIRVPLVDLEPYFFDNPWSELLAGKKVLVIHPFEESIKSQYAKRRLLFKDPRVLPDFELKTLKAVQSLVGNRVDFKDWFAALDWMCGQMDEIDYDMAIIGAGAYGLPLGAHAKKQGRQAIHLGAATQLLFGIRGKRWEDYAEWPHLFNEHWVRPLSHETPENFRMLEKGAYW